MERIDLRFPLSLLVRGVVVVQPADSAVDVQHPDTLSLIHISMYLQTKTDMFAAAASHAGISNVTRYWGEGYWGYSYNSVAAADSLSLIHIWSSR